MACVVLNAAVDCCTPPIASVHGWCIGGKLVMVGGRTPKSCAPQTEVRRQLVEGCSTCLPPRNHLAVVSDVIYGYTIGGRCLSTDTAFTVFERFDSTIRGMDQVGVSMPTHRSVAAVPRIGVVIMAGNTVYYIR